MSKRKPRGTTADVSGRETPMGEAAGAYRAVIAHPVRADALAPPASHRDGAAALMDGQTRAAPSERGILAQRVPRRTLLSNVGGPHPRVARQSAANSDPSTRARAIGQVVMARRPAPLRPVRPPAHMRPIPLPKASVARVGDDWEQSWRELHELMQGSPPSGRLDQRAEAETKADLVFGIGRAQAILAAVVALVAATLMLDGQESALTVLAFVLLAAGGAGLAYLLLQRRDPAALAGIALLGSQLGILVWAFELAGARAALLTFTPALVVFGLRVAGRTLAIVTAIAAFALYVAFTVPQFQEVFQPTLVVSDATVALLDPALLDAALIAVGLCLSLVALLHLHAGRVRALELAQLRQRDAEDLHASYVLLQARVRQDAERLRGALAEALRGQGGKPVAPLIGDASLHQLAALIDHATARLETLQRDREDRVRLEGAIRRVTRAVEQIEMGCVPAWPEPSDTLMDALVVRLRSLHLDAAAVRPAGIPTLRPVGQPRLSPSVAALRSPRPTPGRTTGMILPWRPSRSRDREQAEMPPAWAPWLPLRADDEYHSHD